MRYVVAMTIVATAVWAAIRTTPEAGPRSVAAHDPCPFTWTDRPVDLTRPSDGFHSDVVDDQQMMRRLEIEATRLLDAEGAKITDGKTIADQLKQRRKADVRPPDDQPLVDSPTDLYAKAKSGVLVVAAVFKCGKCDRWHTAPASGFVIGADGLAVTNYHVLDQPERAAFVAMTGDGRAALIEEVLAADKAADVAIVRLAGDGFTPLPVVAEAPVGSEVRVISHPDGRFYSLTGGLVSRYARTPTKSGPADRMCITADYAKGSSGGPVFDERGRVVGLVASTQSVYYNEKDGVQQNLQMVFKLCVPSKSLLDLIGK